VKKPDKMRNELIKLRHSLKDPSLTLLLGAQAVIIFVLPPIFEFDINVSTNWFLGAYVAFILFAVVSSPKLWPMIVIILALCISAAGAVARQIHGDTFTDWFGAVGTISAVLTLSWLVAGIVFAPGRMSEHRIRGAIVLYLNFAIVFENAFRLINELSPGAISGISANATHAQIAGQIMYFSVSTLTTVGYGDMAPINPIARSLTNFEALIGQLYPAIVLARIVTLYTPKEKPNRRK
jgi:hypothetical protein